MKTVACQRAMIVFVLILGCGAVGCGVSYHSTTGQQSTSAASPVISCSANPTSVLSGGIAQVAAKASSPLGLPLTFSFTASAGSISSQGNLATLNTLGSSGTVTVTCKAVDTKGNTSSVTTLVIIETASSQPPVVSCSANPVAVALGGSTTLTAVASSPEGRPLTYSWSASSGTIAGGSISGQSNTATLKSTGSAAGTITVTCGVADDQGRTASATTSVTVTTQATAPPTISCSANPSAVPLGATAHLTATATSPEGRPLSYSWSASSGSIPGGSAPGTANTATLNTAGATAGVITVTCRAADDQGRSASATTTVTVIALIVPAPSISCAANPSIINQGGTAIISAAGQSSQNLGLTYTFSASAGSISANGATATLETSGLSAGFVTVTCTVDQEGGATASATTQVLLQSVTGEQALTAFQFTDSVGVNVHLSYDNNVYGLQFPKIMQSMVDLGIHHYRDGLNQYAPSFQYVNAEALGKAGIKADWIMDINNSADIINSAYVKAPDATAEFEGPNEDDTAAGAPLTAFMQLVHDTVRGNPNTATMPIHAPSFTQPTSYPTQGNLASLITSGTTHDYFGNRNPETPPYGGPFYNCGDYGSMQFNICLAQMVGVNESVVSTETGYKSGGLSDAIIGRYEIRTLFEGLRLGVTRTFLYELIDDPSGDWGLLKADFTPRPVYTGIKNLLSLLNDVSFAQPAKLNYTLTGQTRDVHHLLLQKSDGTFFLAIWLGVRGADPDNPTDTFNVTPLNLILTANTPISFSATYLLDDNGNMTAPSPAPSDGALPISVTDRVTLIALSPGQSR